MNQQNMKAVIIVLLLVWVLLFAIDSMIGIDWPNYTVKRLFIWCPTILVAIYWIFFGAKNKK